MRRGLGWVYVCVLAAMGLSWRVAAQQPAAQGAPATAVRPSPEILYRAPAASPQLENTAAGRLPDSDLRIDRVS